MYLPLNYISQTMGVGQNFIFLARFRRMSQPGEAD